MLRQNSDAEFDDVKVFVYKSGHIMNIMDFKTEAICVKLIK